ncbi:FAD:protein FMN transferase [Methylotenera mobilis]|uniref:FAD:protein FMN transferase n=1 Tax=Methylotenera mobilis (strain JLW8 / ATCC BAA-1282 / DSM 17540) TaxID=583345 RepID=C6WTA5_METML|nr:FAD:protein FMN transferase [Methylotenera mobilis]ACT49167.1 ApbE family lipoprotein [Methylotenera mobilis JLW8]
MRKGLKPLFIVAACCLAIWGLISYKQPKLYHSQSYVFGTLVDISIYGEPEQRAKVLSNHILQDFQQLHQQLHAWKPTTDNQASELGALNAAFASGKPVQISPRMAEILLDATRLSRQSDGLFNPSIGHLIGAWGFQRDEFSAVNIDTALITQLVKANPSMSEIVIKNNTAYSKNPKLKLDLGGYAKGYALDQAIDYLRKQQVHNALINIGGNIIALGQHDDKPWRVGIQHPRKPGAIASLDLDDGWAIGTSGDYQRYFMLGGKRYCHIIDPRTGYPVQHTQAVTVLIPPQAAHSTQAGVLSDVASKPIFIAPLANKAEMAAAMGVQHYMVIDQAAQVYITPAMQTKLTWLDTDLKKHLHAQPTAQH